MVSAEATMLETVIMVLIGLMILAIVLTILFLLYNIRFFYKVQVNAGPSVVSQITFAYKFQEGPLYEIYERLAETSQFCPEKNTIVIHYDDPTKGEDVRSAVGVILTEGDNEKFVDKEIEMKLKELKFKIFDFPNVDFSVRTSYPNSSLSSPSYAANNVYPALERFIMHDKLCARPYLEIHTRDTIHYMAPLSKQADFYVDEMMN